MSEERDETKASELALGESLSDKCEDSQMFFSLFFVHSLQLRSDYLRCRLMWQKIYDYQSSSSLALLDVCFALFQQTQNLAFC